MLMDNLIKKIIIRKNIEYKHNRPTKDVWKSVVSHSFEFFKIGILTSVNSALPNLCLIYLGNNVAYVGVLDVISKISFSIINLFSTISKPLYALSRKKPQIIKKKMHSETDAGDSSSASAEAQPTTGVPECLRHSDSYSKTGTVRQ